jgi:signal transduction histidine kinase
VSTAAPAPISGPLPRLRVGQWLGLTIGLLLAFAVSGIGLALIANGRLSDQRRVVLDQVEPALLDALDLENALINEETGVRGYIITAEPDFLEPYDKGRNAEAQAYVALSRPERSIGSALVADIQAVRSRAEDWRRRFVIPALRRTGQRHSSAIAASLEGKAIFDSIRVSLGHLRGDLTARLAQAHSRLDSDASFLEVVLLVAAALILSSVLGAGVLLRRIITRPLESLGRDTEQVAAGDFAKPVEITGGPREIVQLGGEIDGMRRRIVQELITVESARARLEQQALELQRSNAELEQFAYVASHDLQEPLRKIASFCQALERRYHGQLDARADQYIEFAVDGAKRMQILINDLLAFSRVGRSEREHEPVALEEILAQARSSLSGALADSGGSVLADPLPVVRGEPSLLLSLFQNLISNAIKFRGPESPLVSFAVTRDAQEWSFSVTDNGIGIEPEYAERIFVIFQRLHTKEAYPGTGIGLAMCRKIVEYHGGRMWLDPDHAPGARFRFTLPIAKEETP